MPKTSAYCASEISQFEVYLLPCGELMRTLMLLSAQRLVIHAAQSIAI